MESGKLQMADSSATSPFDTLKTLGVVVSNSRSYVEVMLSNLARNQVSVPLRSASDTERLEMTKTRHVVIPDNEAGWLGLRFASEGGDDCAQISFTSGTQGAPKAVLLSKSNLDSVVQNLVEIMELDSSIREYIGVPVYHSFGYGRARAVLHVGGDAFIPQAGFNLLEIRNMLRAGQINSISAVPSLWRLFLSNLDVFGDELEAVRWVEIGSQPMSSSQKNDLRQALPNAKIIQHYGLTEASRSTFLKVHGEDEAALGSVGRPFGDTKVRINGAGRIEIKGSNVALGVFGEHGFSSLGSSVWFETSDLGRMENRCLFYEGRADDVINCGGVKLSPDQIELYVQKEVMVAGDFGVLRTHDPLRGDAILLVIDPLAEEQREEIVDAIVSYAEHFGLSARDAVKVRVVSDLPRTSTGKLQRKQLALSLENMADSVDGSQGGARQVDNTCHRDEPKGGTLAELIRDLMGEKSNTDASFSELSGDSLLHMQMMLALERSLGEAPDDWEWVPLRSLIEQADGADNLNDVRFARSGAPLPDGSRNLNPKDITFFSLIKEDFLTNDSSVFHQGFLMLLIHRFGNARMDIRWRPLRLLPSLIYKICNKLAQFLFGMKLDYTVKVGRRVKLEHFGGMILGAREIGNDVWIRQNTTFGIRSLDDLDAKPTIGNSVEIGAGAVIVGRIKIGDNSVIGANTVVYSNIPSGSVVSGIPGKVVGQNPTLNPSPLRTA